MFMAGCLIRYCPGLHFVAREIGEGRVSLQFCCGRLFLLHTDSTKMAGSRPDVLAAFNKAKAIVFCKTMTAFMVSDRSKNTMTLELPTLFAKEHGKEMSQDVALVRPTRGSAVWWLRFEGEEESELLNPSRNVDEDMGQSRRTRPSSPSVKLFMKRICPSHGAGKRMKLDIPAQFWRSYGCDKFDRKLYTLEGPRMQGYVRAHVERTQTQTKCAFGQGWKSFYFANKLKIGDVVLFTLTEQYLFAVSIAA